MADNRNRVQAGIATGGQFAAERKSEAAGLSLSAPAAQTHERLPKSFTDPAFTTAVAEFHRVSAVKSHADLVRQHHPEALAVNQNTRYFLDGSGQSHPVDNAALATSDTVLESLRKSAGPEGYVPLRDIDHDHSEAEQAYTKALTQAFLPDGLKGRMQHVAPLPYGVPEDVTISAFVDEQGDETAILRGPDGEAAGQVWVDAEGEMSTEMYEDAPDWAKDNDEAIYETLRMASVNRSNISSHLDGLADSIPGMSERMDKLSSGGADTAPRTLDFPVDLELSGRTPENGQGPATRAAELGLYGTLNPGGNVDLDMGGRSVTIEPNPAATWYPKDLEEALHQHWSDERILISGDLSENEAAETYLEEDIADTDEAYDRLAPHRDRVERNDLALRSLLGGDYDTIRAEFGHHG